MKTAPIEAIQLPSSRGGDLTGAPHWVRKLVDAEKLYPLALGHWGLYQQQTECVAYSIATVRKGDYLVKIGDRVTWMNASDFEAHYERVAE